MKVIVVATILATLVAILTAIGCTATRAGYESAPYTHVESDGNFELRDYPDLAVASSTSKAEEGKGNPSFMRLFRYISGKNDSDQKIAMTTPVFMTGDTPGENVMSFVLPEEFNAGDAPIPATGSKVDLDTIEGGRCAVLRFSGKARDGEMLPEAPLEALRAELSSRGLTAVGTPIYAYFDPPWTPRWFCRSEVMLRIASIDPES